MKKERILITVKTYPNPSKSYIETVCTAGIRENGNWIRLYPINFRLLPQDKQFGKYDFISVPVIKRKKNDIRPESYSPQLEDLEIISTVSTSNNWAERRRLVLGNNESRVYHDMKFLIDKAHKNELSLATYKPKKILYFHFEECEKNWDPATISQIEEMLKQTFLFPDDEARKFNLKKIPYRFKIKFHDIDNSECDYMIEDWEVGANYINFIRRGLSPGDAAEAVKENFNNTLSKNDVYFFVGTRNEAHIRRFPNPFSIIGLFYPPYDIQMGLGI